MTVAFSMAICADFGLEVKITKGIRPCSGIGSSGASAAGGAYLAHVLTVLGMIVGAAVAHNFGLAGNPDSVVDGVYKVGGIGTNGMVAVVLFTAYADIELAVRGIKEGAADFVVKPFENDVLRDAMRRCVLDEGLRMDGRKTDEVRPIWCETSPLPMPHGSAIFQRGETMSLATVTLGTKLDEKMVDGVVSR